jgi:monofunctional biosynthetic peptidoglycan transglycosylase
MIKKILRWLIGLVVAFVALSVLMTVLYEFINPPLTPLMIIRVKEDISEGKGLTIHKSWRSYDKISPNLFRAVIAAEDTKFSEHDGFDWEAIEKAEEHNERRHGKRLYGASTISMQTAKNVFLWPSRSYLRKGLEAYFTVLVELIWSKKRILEVYVNVVQWGDGIYGAEAATQEYFGKSADELTPYEATLMAAVLPNPRRWSPADPTPYIEQRRAVIHSRMYSVPLPK